MTPPVLESESKIAHTSGLSDGPIQSSDVLSPDLYPELKRIAKAKMRRERADHTLQPTALINELYLQFLRKPELAWKDRNHFLLSASQAMRHMLVDHAREKRSEKRGGNAIRLDITNATGIPTTNSEQILDVDAALSRLAQKEPRMARVVELKFFGGLTFMEIGEVLSIGERTAKRDWTLARVWLKEHLGKLNSNERSGMGED